MIAAKVMREVFKRELLPARARWWLAAAGMRDWFSFLKKRLDLPLGGTGRAVLATSAAKTFERRYAHLAAEGAVPRTRGSSGRAPALLMASLYRVALAPDARWIFDGAGGSPTGAFEWLEAARLSRALSIEDRWREVTVHLGELLIVLTEDLPAKLPHARKVLGDVCFEAGVRYARRAKKAWGISGSGDDPPKLAIEVLRTSEYLFRVNPDHWGGADAGLRTGWLEGTACPWFERPGWNGAHCGIFGQFQAGVSSEFGLRYILGKTIPKHGGTTCRIDLKPIELRRKAVFVPRSHDGD